MKNSQMLSGAAMASTLAITLLTGCRSIGPHTIPQDRNNYSDSISESWKRQTLLNIVKLRYVDPPIFVDVGQIVAGYSVEASGNLGGQLSSAGAIQGNSLMLGGAAKFTDRPTVTYTPLTGDKFLRAIMTPLPPESVFFTIESGWPADAVLFSTVGRLNGLVNQSASISGLTPAEPKFLRALELLRRLQLSGAAGMRIEQDQLKRQTTVVTFRAAGVSDEVVADSRELRQLLGLSVDANEFKLVFGAVAANDHELAMQTRSLLHIMGLMAAQVEVPAEHVAKGRASPGAVEATQQGDAPLRLAHILSSRSKPSDAYVAVQYRGHWFYVDDCDLKSKRTFAFMMLLFTLADACDKPALPLITIPAQ